LEKTNTKARVKEKKNRFLSQNSNLRASLVIAPSKEIVYKAREIIRDFLTIRGLELSLEKTLITHIQYFTNS